MIIPLDGKTPRVGRRVYLAPGAYVIGDCQLGDDVGIWFHAVLRGDVEPIVIGDRTNVQDGSVLHTDKGMPCILGNDVTVGHRAIVHGAQVGDGALIGMGATVLSGAIIGEGALVAAGSLVPEGREIPPGWLAMGIPAKPVRELTPQEVDRVKAGVIHYIEQKDSYRTGALGVSTSDVDSNAK